MSMTSYTLSMDPKINALFRAKLAEVIASYEGNDYPASGSRKIVLEWEIKSNERDPDLFTIAFTAKTKLPKPLADHYPAVMVNNDLMVDELQIPETTAANLVNLKR